MSYFPEPYTHSKNKISIYLDLSIRHKIRLKKRKWY